MQATLFSSWCREAKISFWNQQWVYTVTTTQVFPIVQAEGWRNDNAFFATVSTEGTVIVHVEWACASVFLTCANTRRRSSKHKNPALLNARCKHARAETRVAFHSVHFLTRELFSSLYSLYVWAWGGRGIVVLVLWLRWRPNQLLPIPGLLRER